MRSSITSVISPDSRRAASPIRIRFAFLDLPLRFQNAFHHLQYFAAQGGVFPEHLMPHISQNICGLALPNVDLMKVR